MLVKRIIFLNDENNTFNEWLLSVCKKMSTYPHVQYYVVSHACKDNVTLAEEKRQNRLSKWLWCHVRATMTQAMKWLVSPIIFIVYYNCWMQSMISSIHKNNTIYQRVFGWTICRKVWLIIVLNACTRHFVPTKVIFGKIGWDKFGLQLGTKDNELM